MKKFLRWFIAILVVLIVIAVVALVRRDAILRRVTEQRIQQRTGLRAEIGLLKTGLRSTSFLLKNVKLYNRSDFGGSVLLDAPEFFLELDAPLVAESKLHFKELRLNVTELNIIHDKQGRFNLEEAEKEYDQRDAAKPGTAKSGKKVEFAGIDRLLLTVGKIKFTDLKNPSLSREVDVGLKDELVTDIKTEEDVGSQLFRLIVQVAAKPKGTGKAGKFEFLLEPFRDESLTNEAPATPSP
jgi:uncharacterized protein involved in outer membrane biogenesis